MKYDDYRNINDVDQQISITVAALTRDNNVVDGYRKTVCKNEHSRMDANQKDSQITNDDDSRNINDADQLVSN